jgi:molybdopterin molybdotransferase
VEARLRLAGVETEVFTAKPGTDYMTNYEDALNAILQHVTVLPAEEKPLSRGAGQVTAEDVYSDLDLPQTTVAGPDGYAVRSADIREVSRENPVALRIGEVVRAGRLPKREVAAGTAARVMTGSVFPAGADCVVRFEDTDEPPDKNGPNPNLPSSVRIYVAEKAGGNLRRPGGNVQWGTLVLPRGSVIGPAQVHPPFHRSFWKLRHRTGNSVARMHPPSRRSI